MAHPQEPDDRDGDEPGELERVPERDDDKEVEPARSAFLQESDGEDHDESVGNDSNEADQGNPI